MYERVAPFYDLIHADLVEDVSFLLALAERVGGPMLELGCGTGRILLPLARAGHSITGVDNSNAMLERAKLKLRSEPESVRSRMNLVSGDASSVEVDGEFRLVILSYNSLMHFERPALAALLKNARNHLRGDGFFYVDVDNPFEVSDPNDDDLLVLERIMTDPESGDKIIQSASSWVDSDAQRRHISWLFDVSAPAGGPLNRTIVETDYYYLFPHQLESMLAGAGFRLEALYGDYQRRDFGENSPRLIALAKSRARSPG